MTIAAAAAIVGCSRQTGSKWVNRQRRGEGRGSVVAAAPLAAPEAARRSHPLPSADRKTQHLRVVEPADTAVDLAA
jgi:hypothetical protein